MLLESSIKIFHIPNIPTRELLTFGGIFATNKLEYFINNMGTIRVFLRMKTFKNKDIESHKKEYYFFKLKIFSLQIFGAWLR